MGFSPRLEGLFALLGRRADWRWLAAVKNGVRRVGAVVQDNKRKRGAHEDNSRPCGEARKHVGGSTRPEGSLGALSTESAGEIGRAALLDEYNTDQEETHDQVDNDEGVEENLHC